MKIVIMLLVAVAAIVLAAVLFINQKSFGKLPTGERRARMERSWHFKDGKWQNEVPTAMMTSDRSIIAMMWKFIFHKQPDRYPSEPVEAVKTDIRALPKDSDVMVWFGHSSYLLQLSGKRILVDPVFVEASPVAFLNRPFKGSDIYKPEDMPAIDYLVITHDHWDHLDYPTVKAIKDRVEHVIVPLGVGENFEYWGYPAEKITDLDWYESKAFDDGFRFHCMPARHFSGRGLVGKQGLWASFVVESTSGKKVFCGGDSGYGPQFRNIGKMFPNMNLAILENGQYNEDWSQIHTMPRQLPLEMEELGADSYVTVHHGKYSLAYHPWDEPLRNEKDATVKTGKPVGTLVIGRVTEIR